MSFIDFNESCLNCIKEVSSPIITKDDCESFVEYLETSDILRNAFDSCDDAGSFKKSFPDTSAIFGPKSTELFYAVKNGEFYPGVPSRLVYALKDAKRKYKDFPNMAIQYCYKIVSIYGGAVFINNEDKPTVKQVIDRVFGMSVNLLTGYKPLAGNNGVYEIYVKEANRVVLLPKDIYDTLSLSDFDDLDYDEKIGVTYQDIPLRCFNNRVGITTNEFDLRESC